MLTELAAIITVGCTVMLPNLYLKDGVRVNGFHFTSEIVRILDVARETAPKMERDAVWITSANDRKHRDDSLHYQNKAFDIRVMNIIGDVHREAKLWAKRMQAELGLDYDVVYEINHIHIEHDPYTTKKEERPEDDYGLDYCTG